MRSASIAVLLSLLMLVPSAAASWGIPEPVTDRMDRINDIYEQILLAGVIVFLIFFAWMILNLVLFRPGGRGKQTFEDHRDNLTAEVIWTVIPLIIVAWVGYVAYDGMAELNDIELTDETVEIGMIGNQWFWEATYGDNVRLSQFPDEENGTLAGEDPFLIPADTPIRFNVTSNDVIHSFWVPEFGGKVDAVPGQNTFFTVTVPEGEYRIKCAEFCGGSHAYMAATLKAVPEPEFDSWVDERIREARAAGVAQSLTVNITDDGLTSSAPHLVAGVGAQLKVNNQASDEASFAIEGVEDATIDAIPAGTTAVVNVTLEPGTYTLASGERTAEFEALEAETIDVELFEWGISPGSLNLEVGKAYVFNVENVGDVQHNLYLGIHERTGEQRQVYWATPNLQSGQASTLVVIPEPSHTDATQGWCDVPGHYSQGMIAELSIA